MARLGTYSLLAQAWAANLAARLVLAAVVLLKVANDGDHEGGPEKGGGAIERAVAHFVHDRGPPSSRRGSFRDGSCLHKREILCFAVGSLSRVELHCH